MKLNELVQKHRDLDTIAAETMDELLEEACAECAAAWERKDVEAIKQLVCDLELIPDLLIRTWSSIIGNNRVEASKWYHRYFVEALLRTCKL